MIKFLHRLNLPEKLVSDPGGAWLSLHPAALRVTVFLLLMLLLSPVAAVAEEQTASCSYSGAEDAFFTADELSISDVVTSSTIGTQETPWTLSLATGGYAEITLKSNNLCQWKKISCEVSVKDGSTITIGEVSKVLSDGGSATFELTYGELLNEEQLKVSASNATTITFKSITLTYDLEPQLPLYWYSMDSDQETVHTETNPYEISFKSAASQETFSPVYLHYDSDWVHLNEFTFTSSNEKVAKVEMVDEDSYKITPISAGSTVITAAFAGNDYYTANSVAFKLNLTPTDISSAYLVSTSNNVVDYNGAVQAPTITVTESGFSEQGEVLNAETDYSVSYKQGETVVEPKNAGTYTVVVTGTGNYTGTITVEESFTINKIDAELTKAPAAKKGLTYTGEKQELITAGVVNGGTLLYSLYSGAPENFSSDIPKKTDAADYFVYYKIAGDENHNDVVGDDGYIDFIPVSIGKASISPSVTLEGWTYGSTANTPTLTDNTGEGAVTYTYKVKDTDDETYTKTVPTAVGNYTVKATVAATGNYNGGTATADFTISAKSIADVTITPSADGFVYTGQAQTPTSVVVKDGETTLTATTDYTIAYSNNTDAGNATITVTGTGNYTGTATQTFTISPKSISNATIEEVGEYTYTGEEICPKPAVTIVLIEGGEATTLVEGTDFTYNYDNNINSTENSAIVFATGKGNYKDNSQTVYFSINKATPSVTAPAAVTGLTYTGSAQALITAGETTGGTIQYSTDDKEYNTDLPTGTSVGEYTVYYKVVGDENYNDVAAENIKVTIAPNAAVTMTVELTDASATYTYDGTAKKPGVTVKSGGTTLTLNTDYTIAYTNNTNAGTATVTVTGTGKYDGADPVFTTFTIKKATISAVTIEKTELTYTGSEQTVSVTKVMAGDLEVAADYYTVSGNTATDAGTYTVTVTANDQLEWNNFTGSNTATFTINHRTAEITAFADGQTYGSYYSANEDFLVPEGYTPYIVTAVSGTTVTVRQVSYLKAGVPILLKKATASGSGSDDFSGNLLQAAESDVTASGFMYVLFNNKFTRATGSIAAGKCYLTLEQAPAGSRTLTISDGSDGSTAVDRVVGQTDGQEVWYNMQGRKVQKPTKAGLYIVNGKKVVINNK